MKTTIAFFGTPQIAATVLANLIKSKFNPQLVVTSANVGQGRERKLSVSPTKEVAQKHKIKTLEPGNLDKNFAREFRKFSPDVAILVAYGKLIPKEVLVIPKYGFVNIHPSLLPKYRGPSPIIEAILNGDSKTGVTIIKLDQELDHGPILAQIEQTVDANDTHQSLSEKLASLGADLLISILPKYVEGSLKLKKQDHNAATYTEKISKEDGHIDLENPPDPQKLNRMIRAFYPWPGVWTDLETRNKKQETRKMRIKFLPPTIQLFSAQGGSSSRGNYPSPKAGPPLEETIQLFLIQPEGKRPMNIKEFLNGFPQAKDAIEKLT